MKIRYVQLESDAFLTDVDFVQMSPAERGAYCSLIFYLTSNNGKCDCDPEVLSRMCNCQTSEEFERIWQRIGKKFQKRAGLIRHKRVTKELARARKLRQAKRRAGINGAKKRWHSDNTAMAKESEGNVNEKVRENTPNTNTGEQAHFSSSSVRSWRQQGIDFGEALAGTISARNRSDSTCFANVAEWLVAGCASGRFDGEIFGRVLDLAREAQAGTNPAALFMTLLKKELGYSGQVKR